MALLTEGKLNQFGVTEEYWRILNINLNPRYNYCDITIGAYMNMETRLSECEPMNIKKVRAKWEQGEYVNNFSPESMNAENINIYNKAYAYIKEKDEYFADAIDC